MGHQGRPPEEADGGRRAGRQGPDDPQDDGRPRGRADPGAERGSALAARQGRQDEVRLAARPDRSVVLPPKTPQPAPRDQVPETCTQLLGSQQASPQATGGRPSSERASLIVSTPYFSASSRSRRFSSRLADTGSSLARNSRPLGSYS